MRVEYDPKCSPHPAQSNPKRAEGKCEVSVECEHGKVRWGWSSARKTLIIQDFAIVTQPKQGNRRRYKALVRVPIRA